MKNINFFYNARPAPFSVTIRILQLLAAGKKNSSIKEQAAGLRHTKASTEAGNFFVVEAELDKS